jgi:hypothetical protein
MLRCVTCHLYGSWSRYCPHQQNAVTRRQNKKSRHSKTTTMRKQRLPFLSFFFQDHAALSAPVLCFSNSASAAFCQHHFSRICYVGPIVLLFLFSAIRTILPSRCSPEHLAMLAHVFVALNQHQPSTDLHLQYWNHWIPM